MTKTIVMMTTMVIKRVERRVSFGLKINQQLDCNALAITSTGSLQDDLGSKHITVNRPIY